MDSFVIASAARVTITRQGSHLHIEILKMWTDVAQNTDNRDQLDILILGDPEFVDATQSKESDHG